MNRRRFIAISAGTTVTGWLYNPLLRAQALNPEGPNYAAGDRYRVKWMKQHAGANAHYLRTDPRFARFVDEHLRGLYIKRAPLDRWADCLLRIGGQVRVTHNRYVAATGKLLRFDFARAMLWVDTHIDAITGAPPTVVFAVMDGTGRRGRGTNCWIVSNQELADLMVADVPRKIRADFGRWLKEMPLKTEGRS